MKREGSAPSHPEAAITFDAEKTTSSKVRNLTRSTVSVLVVDDCLTDRHLYEGMLRRDPSIEYALESCATGAEAIARVREKVPDCILLDFHLSDGTALDLLDQLSKIADLGTLPVVVASGNDDPALIDQIFRSGAVDFLHKGQLSATDLCKTLRYAVERARNQEFRGQIARSQRLMSLGQVAASVAHEINNPAAFVLTNLLSSQALLANLQGRADREPTIEWNGERSPAELIAELQSLTQDNIDGIRRIATIVAELRLFSHPRTESVERVDLNDVVRIATKLLGGKLQASGNLKLELSPLPKIFADRGRMVQVLVNLLDNASGALREESTRGGEIEVTTRSRDDWLELSVRDTGRGMPKEVQARAFEPFFTTKGAGVGTGLGLSLCAEYVHQHGGEIELDSAEGRGTKVTVRIPRRTGLVPVSDRAPVSDAVQKTAGHVVIIDDEAPLLRAFQRVLAGHHTVATFERARDALGALKAGLPAAAIICDVNMPDLDGPSIYREVVEFSPELASRIVFCTGGAFSETSRNLLEETGLQVLSKPVEPTTLLRAISAVMST